MTQFNDMPWSLLFIIRLGMSFSAINQMVETHHFLTRLVSYFMNMIHMGKQVMHKVRRSTAS